MIKFGFIFLCLILVILMFYIVKLKIKVNKQKLEIKNLNYVCDETRSFRHDFNNIMQAIGGYIKTNNMYDLKKYYNKLIPECFHVNNLYQFHSKLIANSAIYSIIANKYNLAEKNNIKMSLDIQTDLNSLNLDTYNLSRILGILLDNAIEASKECPRKIVNLSFKNGDNKKLVIVENTYLNKGVCLKKIFNKNYTTKKNNSGLGLWEISNIINKKKNIKLNTTANADFFCQELEIM